MNKISVSIPMPHEGEDIEHLDRLLFEDNIKAELRKTYPEAKIYINVFEHDGTGTDEIYSPSEDDEDYDQFVSILTDAVAAAFCDEASYTN